MPKFQIKSRWGGDVIYSASGESLRDVVGSANLRGASLSGANLSEADLRWADLSEANLSEADLRGADLSGANLRGAYLSGADLRGADLRGADLSRADLSRASLRGARGLNKFRTQALLMLLDQPGPIRAYKLVKIDGRSPLAAMNGGVEFIYEIGKMLEEPDANTDPTELCGKGIHVATLDWVLRNYKSGTHKVFVVEFTAADIACIPIASDGKFRVFCCTPVGEKTEEEMGLIVEREESAARSKN
jgi:hypothetical protein